MFNLDDFLQCIREKLYSYVEGRKNDVARGAETAELAALLVQKYGYGLADSANIAANFLDCPQPDLISDVDQLVASIDPDWRANQQRRFSARPASLALTNN
ncbi:hypothetical protein [Janthinobacterium sp. BJB304]|uniref:hypothetical protein n=1 Tax=Janthinobacterium sp. BJB304 TaxID=1572871 RepID=UPI000C0E13DD|nr:hypothetical protein [Janthinobacterium sp. BJB304]PHV35989.1 hypothetical protein CSQ95_26650 [Janthinobacterium sp. BJB304]